MNVNKKDVEWNEYDLGEEQFRRKELSNAVETENIGTSLYELFPGDRSWPYHYHTANEEALFVLSGTGLLRTDDGSERLKPGDFIALPAEEAGGHQIVNDSDGRVRYLMISTMNEPDVVVYPEREQIGVFAGAPPGKHTERTVECYYDTDDEAGFRTE
jgi:uncharacterized cupin superfamily protein